MNMYPEDMQSQQEISDAAFEARLTRALELRRCELPPTRVTKGEVEVGPRYSVTSQLKPVRARDPGEFTGGIWEYLYPPRPSTFPAP